MTISALKELNVLDELYTEENPSEVNLKRLASFLQLRDKELAEALKIDPTQFSRKPYASSNAILKQWQLVFNLIIRIISESEPELAPEQIKIKMQRWLRLPRPEFSGESALQFMLNGKARRVKNILEQIAV